MSEWRDDPEPIHGWFGLTYSNYLVLPRSVLQSMPQEWQAKFCELLDEAQEEFSHLDWPPYDVRALAREPERVEHEDCFACHGTGLMSDLTCGECDGDGEIEVDERWETPEEVGIIADPIPHYNRGRTRIARPPENPDGQEAQ